MDISTAAIKVPAGPFRAKLRTTARCGIVTPETEYQAGLRGDDAYEGPSRLFFGVQTHADSMALFAEQHLAGIAGEAEVVGYFKYRESAIGLYLDESALFVERLTIL
jgi:hypothetical protein